jgi:hypothetical protein
MRELIRSIASVLTAAAANDQLPEEVLVALVRALCSIVTAPQPTTGRRSNQ